MKMRLLAGFAAALLAVLVVSGCGKNDASRITTPSTSSPTALAAGQGMSLQNDPNLYVPESSVPRSGEMHTNHIIYIGQTGQMTPLLAPGGYGPSQIRTAYNIPSVGGSGTIVIVDAYDDPYALQDFNAFSMQYGLPLQNSLNPTSPGNKVFQVVYASGTKPAYNSGWSQEEALDVEWSHAMAPNAKIVLLEAASNSYNDLFTADDKAATIVGAQQCSNSWGGGEDPSEGSWDTHYNHPGVVYLASGGDSGGQQGYPAASPYVIAVGGTSLHLDGSNHRTSETVWSDTGCGPSAYESRPTYQNGVANVVGNQRGIDDISAVADPYTGVAVRWHGGWYVFGGTSVSSPVMAGIINNAGKKLGSAPAENTYIYSGLGGANYYDVTSGSAGAYPGKVGYDFPTGVGAPAGVAGY